MAKRRQTKHNTSAKVFLLVFLIGILLLVAAGATFVGVKSEGFKNFEFFTGTSESTGNDSETNDTFALRMNGEEFSSVNILSAEKIRIDVENGGNFSVLVQPKADVDFEFLLDGTLHQFATADGDYNRAFDVQVNTEDGYFVLHKQENIAGALQAAYEGKEISDIDSNFSGALFDVIVTAENGEAKTFTIAGIVGDVMTVEIEPTEIVF